LTEPPDREEGADVNGQTTTQKTTLRGRVRVERGAKRIRAFLGGELVADTTSPLLVWEKPYYPAYYLPVEDVRTELLTADGGVTHSPSRGDGRTFTVAAGGEVRVGAAVRFADSPFDDLRDAVRLEWDAMDAWFEEDEQVFTHPRDPYTRLDLLASSRHVRIEIGGVTVAESLRPTLAFETNLATRFYVPRTHVRMELLTASETRSHCPYKGEAEYWSATVNGEVHPDVAWSYRTPLPESQKLAGLVAFYDERVALYVDGVLQGKAANGRARQS
jgi:uncharacterized protein (DUF427 family)